MTSIPEVCGVAAWHESLLVARALNWRLAEAQIELINGRSPLDAGPLARWYCDRILSPSAHVVTPSGPRPRAARSLVLTLGVAAALTVPSLGALALPDFAGASTLAAHQIAGDSAMRAPPCSTQIRCRLVMTPRLSSVFQDHRSTFFRDHRGRGVGVA